MDYSVKLIIIAAASALAIFLIFFGIKDIKIKKGKYGLFISSLLIAMSFYNCSNAKNQYHIKTEIRRNSSDCKNIDKLFSSDNWKKLSILWIKLDNIEPLVKDASLFKAEYDRSLKVGESDTLQKELSEIINNLKQENTEFEIELMLLDKLCRSRIIYMTYGNPLMMMHRMPSSSENFKMDCLIDIERRTDKIIKLREKGLIDEEEFNIASDNILQAIKAFSILDVFINNFQYLYESNSLAYFNSADHYNITLLSTLNSYKSHFENLKIKKENGTLDSYEIANYDEKIKKYEKINDEISEIQKVFPIFESLIANLSGRDIHYKKRIKDIQEKKAFNEFKAFWKELDNLGNQKDTENKSLLIFYGSDSLSNDLKLKLEVLLSSLELEEKLSPDELDIIKHFCNLRIDNQFPYEDMKLMVMHYIPPPPPNKYYKNNIRESLSILERKIDTLSSLKENNLINEIEFDCAIENLTIYLNNVIITSVIYENYTLQGNEFAYNYENTLDGNIQCFYEDYIDRTPKEVLVDDNFETNHLNKMFINTNKMIAKTRRLLPFLKEFFRSMEN